MKAAFLLLTLVRSGADANSGPVAALAHSLARFLGPVDDEILVGLPEKQSLNTPIHSESSFCSDIELSG